MKFLERDLEEIIYNSERDMIIDRGLHVANEIKRQLRIGNYGIADLVGIDKPYYHTGFKDHCKGVITVYELKQERIGVSTFFQALNYLKGIRHFLELRKLDHLFNYSVVLIGNSFDKNSSFVYLGDIFDDELCETCINDISKTSVELYQYQYEITGIEFNRIHRYRLIRNGFKIKDKTPF